MSTVSKNHQTTTTTTTTSTVLVFGLVSVTAVLYSVLSWRKINYLRKELDKVLQNSYPNEDNNDDNHQSIGTTKPITLEKSLNDQQGLVVQPIGTIRSIYRLCVGTPRQGLLAPNARGRIELLKLGDSSAAASVDGLEGFTYIWIIFVFHLNTQSNYKQRRFKSKISPPALGGKKVGIFATRSPHRYNPIGITLCKLEQIQVNGPHSVTIHVSGLDLVDQTPVLDIKPYVPVYDSINNDLSHVSSSSMDPSLLLPPPETPEWVEGGLATSRKVVIKDEAEIQLKGILDDNPNALDFYGPKNGDVDTFQSVIDCIRQVLAMDVRSAYQTQKTRKGRFQAERAERVQKSFGVNGNNSTKEEIDNDDSEGTSCCTQQLDNLMIYYQVQEAKERKRKPSENSGAEDIIVVERIALLPQCQNTIF
jgi:tRNA-Thr(GGU) m(6)t(6)A37 methyltransferase TsaA